MKVFVVKQISVRRSSRCEVCHQADLYNSETDFCSRCAPVISAMAQSEKRKHAECLRWRWLLPIGLASVASIIYLETSCMNQTEFDIRLIICFFLVGLLCSGLLYWRK